MGSETRLTESELDELERLAKRADVAFEAHAADIETGKDNDAVDLFESACHPATIVRMIAELREYRAAARAAGISNDYMRLIVECESADDCHQRHPEVPAQITVNTSIVRAVLRELDAARERIQQATYHCEQGIGRAANFMEGMKMAGKPGPNFVMIQAVQADIIEARQALASNTAARAAGDQ